MIGMLVFALLYNLLRMYIDNGWMIGYMLTLVCGFSFILTMELDLVFRILNMVMFEKFYIYSENLIRMLAKLQKSQWITPGGW